MEERTETFAERLMREREEMTVQMEQEMAQHEKMANAIDAEDPDRLDYEKNFVKGKGLAETEYETPASYITNIDQFAEEQHDLMNLLEEEHQLGQSARYRKMDPIENGEWLARQATRNVGLLTETEDEIDYVATMFEEN